MPIESLHTIFQKVYTNPYSDFYQKLYAHRANITADFPRTAKEWSSIPFLTKEDLMRTPFSERVFLPRDAVDNIRSTSGTSGKLLIIPHGAVRFGAFNLDGLLGEKIDDDARIRILSFMRGIPNNQENSSADISTVLGDISNPALSARIGKLFSINALYSTPYFLLSFIPHLKKEGVLGNIRWIKLFGDKCFAEQYEVIKKTFSHSKICHTYSIAEMQSRVAESCRETEKKGLNLYHAKSDALYWELIDSETDEVLSTVGSEGEVVLTNLHVEHNPLPLVRYKTGDRAALRDIACPCGSPYPVYEILGRKTLDKIRITGGEIHLEEARRVVRLMKELVGTNFELHLYYEKMDDTILPKIILKVETREGADMTLLAKDIARIFRLSPTFTYAEGVEKNLFLPLVCVPLEIQRTKIKEMLFEHM